MMVILVATVCVQIAKTSDTQLQLPSHKIMIVFEYLNMIIIYFGILLSFYMWIGGYRL